MAHPEQLYFVHLVRELFPDIFHGKRVLEIGSLDINGTVRNLFSDGDYIGLDVADGHGVDVVCQGQDYDAPDGSFDTVICCEVMEHNPHWLETMQNMIRLCRPGGAIVMTCASTGRPEHGTSRTTPGYSPLTVDLGWNYYRNLNAKNFTDSINLLEFLYPFRFFTNPASQDLYFLGFRRGAPAPTNAMIGLNKIGRYYIMNLLVSSAKRLKKKVLIGLVGEERYNAGPVRPW